MNKPHWINITGRDKGEKFRCSKCQGECYCKYYGAYKRTNYCSYQYCPRCGSEMDLGALTKLVQVEVRVSK